MRHFGEDEVLLGKKYGLHVMLGQMGKSHDVINSILSINPSNIKMRILRGKYFLDKGKYKDAETDFRHILDKEENVQARIGLARLNIVKGNSTEAINLVDTALTHAKEDLDILYCLETSARLHIEQDSGR